MNAAPPTMPPKPWGGKTQEELDALAAQGYEVYEDGSMVGPDGQGVPAYDSPNDFGPAYDMGMGGFNASPLLTGPGPADAPPDPFATNPIFAAHMAVRNPVKPEPDLMTRMQRQQAKALGLKEPKMGPNVSVPGGASITNGSPSAAPATSPQYTQADDPKGDKKGYPGRFGRRQEQRANSRR